MHKINLTTDELRLILEIIHTIQVPGKNVRIVGMLYDKIATEIEKTEVKNKEQ